MSSYYDALSIRERASEVKFVSGQSIVGTSSYKAMHGFGAPQGQDLQAVEDQDLMAVGTAMR